MPNPQLLNHGFRLTEQPGEKPRQSFRRVDRQKDPKVPRLLGLLIPNSKPTKPLL